MLRLSLTRASPVIKALANTAPRRCYSTPWHWHKRGFISNRRLIENMFGRGSVEKFFDPKIWENMGFTYNMKEVNLTKEGFQVGLNLREFAPEDIRVVQTGRTLNVTAKHERSDNSTDVTRNFEWVFTVPEEVKLDTLESKFSDGYLTLTAEVEGASNDEVKEHEIKIERK